MNMDKAIKIIAIVAAIATAAVEVLKDSQEQKA